VFHNVATLLCFLSVYNVTTRKPSLLLGSITFKPAQPITKKYFSVRSLIINHLQKRPTNQFRPPPPPFLHSLTLATFVSPSSIATYRQAHFPSEPLYRVESTFTYATRRLVVRSLCPLFRSSSIFAFRFES